MIAHIIVIPLIVRKIEYKVLACKPYLLILFSNNFALPFFSSIINKNKEARAKERESKKQQSQVGGRDVKIGSTASIAAASNSSGSRTISAPPASLDRRHLHNYRVVQRNLVYVIGLPGSLSSEETLRKPEYFGQYGKIGKIVVHKTHGTGSSTASTSVSAYVTFVHKEDAKASIQSLEGHWIENHVLRASFGTTKYCNNFIRGLSCNNPECVYLHEMGNDEDRFTKAEIQAGHSKLNPVPGQNQQLVTGMGGPSGTGKRPTGEPVLPPPVFLKDVPTAIVEVAPSPAVTKPPLQRNSSWGANNGQQGVPVALIRSTSHGSESDNKIPTSSKGDSSETEDRDSNIKDSDVTQKEKAQEKDKEDSAKKAANTKAAEPPTSAKAIAKAAERDRIAADKRAAERAQQEKQDKAAVTQGVPGQSGTQAQTLAAADKKETEAEKATQQTPDTQANSAEDKVSSTKMSSADTKKWDDVGVISASFNGFGRCALFTVPISTFGQGSVWSAVMNSSNGETGSLLVNPYLGGARMSVSELFDLTLPPVDAVGLPVWPKPLSHYTKLLSSTPNPNAPQKITPVGLEPELPHARPNTNMPMDASINIGLPNHMNASMQANLPPHPASRAGSIRSLQSVLPGARVSG